jgi:hypothetical protein
MVYSMRFDPWSDQLQLPTTTYLLLCEEYAAPWSARDALYFDALR